MKIMSQSIFMIFLGMPYYDEYYDRAVGVFLLILTLIGDNDNIHN